MRPHFKPHKRDKQKKRKEMKRNENMVRIGCMLCCICVLGIGFHWYACECQQRISFLSLCFGPFTPFIHIRAYVRTNVNYFQHQNSKTSYSNIKESLKFKCVIAFLSPLKEILINWVITSNKMVKYMRMRRAFHYSAQYCTDDDYGYNIWQSIPEIGTFSNYIYALNNKEFIQIIALSLQMQRTNRKKIKQNVKQWLEKRTVETNIPSINHIAIDIDIAVLYSFDFSLMSFGFLTFFNSFVCLCFWNLPLLTVLIFITVCFRRNFL